MSKDLLWEIGLEEVPSGFMPGILEQLEQLTRERFHKARIALTEVHAWGTPRRLVLWLKELSEYQEDMELESRGPKKQAAYDDKGQPTKALLGFAKAQGMEIDQLEIRTVGEVEYLFAVKSLKGRATAEVLPELLMELLGDLNFPKSMRWGYRALRFVRPIRWMLTMYGDELLPLTVENIKSEKLTYGHRFLSFGALAVESIAQYFTLLKQHYVIVDPDERLAMIREQIAQVAADNSGKVMENEALLQEVNFLVEYPTAFYGRFSPSYLAVPVEVLTTTMVNNQKYFPLFAEDGKLMPGFIGIRNGTEASLSVVAAGNERVLKARLEDALFFWNEDIEKSMEALAEGLSGVMFHEKLGSMRQKIERLEILAGFIGSSFKLSEPDRLSRAAHLCKADLLSSMVYEFPELQGIMGRYYAQRQGEASEVAQAILEHYMPRYAGDNLPQTETGTVLALAEKIDNLTGFFMIGAKPSGSQDPYALRRQALGIVHIMLEGKLAIDLRDLVLYAYEQFPHAEAKISADQAGSEVVDFVNGRLKGVLQEKAYSYDVIDAVLANTSGRIYEAAAKTEAITQGREQAWFEDFITVYNRSHNLTKKWQGSEVEPSAFADKTEEVLWDKLKIQLELADNSLKQGSYAEAMMSLAGIRPELDAFFNAVMVMAEDEKLKANRLNLLKMLADRGNKIANFSLLVV